MWRSHCPSVPTIQHFQALWAAHHFTKYTYDSETTGFFNNLSGQAFRIVVLGDTVRSAQSIATGDSVPLAVTKFTTIDGLFAAAITALNAGTLTNGAFDPSLSFPTRLDISGPPDASGSIFASNLQVLP
ncbi:MAG: DUF6174 domain-containing protein [Gemmatimonadota bacterium]